MTVWASFFLQETRESSKMKTQLAIVTALLSVLLVSQVAYAGMEEVILKDGTSHRAEVSGTTWNSVTVKKSKGEARSA